MACLFIPASLRDVTQGVTSLEVPAATVGDALDAADQLHPGLRCRLCDGTRLRAGLMLSIDGRIATLGLREPVEAHTEIHFIPAIGGG